MIVKLKKEIVVIFLIIILMVILLIFGKNTYAVDSDIKSYSREELEDFVVATGLSYFYNNTKSDYEQRTMDLKETFNWRTFLQSPEMINRASNYFIDCSSFVSSVYIHSLGYDFSSHFKHSDSYIYWPTDINANSNGKIGAGKSLENFKIAYKYIGKGINTNFFANIGKDAVVQNYGNYVNNNNEYVNNNLDNRNLGVEKTVVYHYNVTGNESDTVKNSVRDNLTGENKILRPGDLVIYRRGEAETGHVILYVGDVFDSNGGFVHATGSDYKFPSDTEELNFGIDDYSVRYNDLTLLINNVFNKNTSTENSSFTVLRPINNYCNGNNCTISTCSDSSCGDGYLNNNVKARVDLNELRVEQYIRITKDYYENLDLSGEKTTNVNELSEYNSVSVGDEITYNLYFVNKTKKETTYSDLTISSKIPNNTTFVGCTRDCEYDSSKRTIIWKWLKEDKLSKDGEKTYRYTVKVDAGQSVINEGMKIETSNGNILQLSPSVTKINPTINGINIKLLKDEIDKFSNLVENDQIIYDSNSYSSYIKDLDNITSIKLSQFGFIKMIYYNALGIDIGYLKLSNIKEGLFNVDTINDGFYVKKKDAEVELLVDENSKNINKMLVSGIYGGRLLKGNENLDRAKYLRPADLEVGDILVFFYDNAEKISTSIYLGLDKDKNPSFAKFQSDNTVVIYDINNTDKTGFDFFKEMYTKDLFVVLRPTQLYGTTVQYEYNGATKKGDNSYVAYNIYRDLVKPVKKDNKITLVYNKNNIDDEIHTIKNTFGGWYSDKDFTNKVDNTTNLVSNLNHMLYAKWNVDAIKLPELEVDGYMIEGWYADSELTRKVANAGDNYLGNNSETLYAKWVNIDNSYKLSFDLDLNVDDENNYIKYLTRNTTVRELLDKIVIQNGIVKVFNSSSDEKRDNDILATGDILRVYVNNEIKEEYVLSIIGDSNGDGKIDLIDLSYIRKHIVGWINPNTNIIQYQTGVNYYALDFNKDDKVDLIDLSKMRKIIVGLE